MKVFVTKVFARFARSGRISDQMLCDAIARAGQGLIAADLGGGLIKQRIARRGQGRSGGFRTVIAYRFEDKAVFVHGSAKNERDNVNAEDLKRLKKLADLYLHAPDLDIESWCARGELKEIDCGGKAEISEPDR